MNDVQIQECPSHTFCVVVDGRPFLARKQEDATWLEEELKALARFRSLVRKAVDELSEKPQ